MIIAKVKDNGYEIHHLDRYYVFDDFPDKQLLSNDFDNAIAWCDDKIQKELTDYYFTWTLLAMTLLEGNRNRWDGFVLAHDNHELYDELICGNIAYKDFFY